jgi:hypothetical protein
MNGTVTVLAASADTRRGLTIGLFAAFIAVTLYITTTCPPPRSSASPV